MSPEKRVTSREDWVRLRHMLEAAEQALMFVAGRTRADLETDAMLRRAVVHCLQEIGEAACRVTAATQAGVPIPWKSIVGMRNRLVHAYFEIDLDAVWKAMMEDLEPLSEALRPVVGDEGRE